MNTVEPLILVFESM